MLVYALLETMWFAVDILYKGTHSEKPGICELWEECIILVEASDSSTAREIARPLAISEEHEYRSVEGDLIRWEFDVILSVYEILSEEIVTGVEVFSRFLRASEVKSLKRPFED